MLAMRRVVPLLLGSAVLVGLLQTSSGAATPPPRKTPSPSYARQYAAFLKFRNEALATWLPQNEDLFEPWRRHRAAVAALGWNELFTIPRGATFFWHGDAGPPKVNLFYDPVRHVALYSQGCCTWEETVLATVSKPPPSTVKAANLGAMRSRRGIALGASPRAVRRAYGPARLYPSTTTPGVRVLSYWRNQFVKGSGCAWFENFAFRHNRLIEIQAGHGC